MSNNFKKTKYAIESCNKAYLQNIDKYENILNKDEFLNIDTTIEHVISGHNFKLKNVDYDKLKDELIRVIISKNKPNLHNLVRVLNNIKDDNVKNEIDDINYKIFCKIIDKCIEDILNLENPTNLDIVALLSLSEYIAEFHINSIPSSKLRDFYDYIISIDENNENENWFFKFALLKSKIAYHVGKEKNTDSKYALKKLGYIIDSAIVKIRAEPDENKEKKYFKNFKTFLESIVAYHKLYAKSN
jgi:CRISPR-associated protein Csm2